jgi:hypothetical protein
MDPAGPGVIGACKLGKNAGDCHTLCGLGRNEAGRVQNGMQGADDGVFDVGFFSHCILQSALTSVHCNVQLLQQATK